jgi:MFS family permease
MAVAPTLWVAIAGAAIAGVGNGVESVAGRTALQEEVDEGWMAVMMSVNESMFELVPGVGILLGGAIAALAGPRAALGVAGLGSLVVMVAVWVALRPGVLRSEAPRMASPVSHPDKAAAQPRTKRPTARAQSQHPQ